MPRETVLPLRSIRPIDGGAGAGLERRWARHREVAEEFWRKVEAMGLELLVAHEHRLPTLTTIKVPPGIDATKVVTYILQKYQVEIGNGLGDLRGKAWRIGLMGYNSRHDVSMTVLGALKDALAQQGWTGRQGKCVLSKL